MMPCASRCCASPRPFGSSSDESRRFGVEVPTISYHLKEIYASGELTREATLRRILGVQTEGNPEVRREIESATSTRSSRLATDKHAPTTETFFKTVQNKLHWAVTRKTAAELIAERADAAKPSMGLTTWKNAPKGKVLKSDISVSKDYLLESEIKKLERIVSMYLDYAENQAARQIPMKMVEWVGKLDAFLQFNEYEVLSNAGKVSAEVAKRLAEEQYEAFRVRQDRAFESDFEAEVKRLESKRPRRKKEGP